VRRDDELAGFSEAEALADVLEAALHGERGGGEDDGGDGLKDHFESSSETSMGVAWRKVVRDCWRGEREEAFSPEEPAPIPRDAALHPIDHVAGVGFEQELELGAEAGDALAQAGRFVDAFEGLHFGFKAAKDGADGEVEVAGGFEELFAGVEGLAAVAGDGQAGEEEAGALAELLGDGGERLGALLAAELGIGVAGQLFKTEIADGEAEVLRGDFFELVRLVEDHGGSLGQDAGIGRAPGLLLDGEVGEEEVVVDDDEVGLEGLAAHLGDEAAAVIGAGLAEAGIAAGVELVPQRARLGHAG
jgi:hypothetical protein